MEVFKPGFRDPARTPAHVRYSDLLCPTICRLSAGDQSDQLSAPAPVASSDKLRRWQL